MRILLILRGAPGCGKTTWVKNNHLIPYTLSFDNIRMLYKSPIQTIYGRESHDRKKDSMVFEVVLSILAERMKRGELTIIDAVNSKADEVTRYYEMANENRYRTYIVDFTDISVKVSKQRNAERMARKRVPDHIIEKVYNEFKTETLPEISSIKPNQLNSIWPKPLNLNKYKKVHHIGDVHGCLDVLKDAVEDNGGLNKDEYYIFLGDYTDRGPDSIGTLRYINALREKENVCFCEGNHERWVWNWLCGIDEYADEFRFNTQPKMEKADFDKQDLKKFYKSLKECCYYKYKGKEVLACHGGLAAIPENLAQISTFQLIYGVGLHSDIDQIAKTFKDQSEGKRIEVFGHRNPDNRPAVINDSVYFLEGGVEAGGALRWMTFDKNGIQIKEYNCKKS